MKPYQIYSILIPILISCGTGNEPGNYKDVKTDAKNSTVKITTNELSGCYLMNIGKDTARLILKINAAIVMGSLSYKRYEKDNNNGIIEGKIEHNIIKVWYKFKSEGTVSVREIYFKINGNDLAEGYGEVDLRNDTVFFRYPTALRYEANHPYVKVNCN